MTDAERRAAATKFAAYWKGKGYEKGESQPFWLSLLRDVLGVAEPEKFITFEDQVRLDHTSFIDGNIPSTHVLIEQKGLDKDLRKPIKQSDGTLLTPFQQAKRYAFELPYSERPRWIVTCNFGAFLVYDMEHPSSEPEEILLSKLSTDYYRLQFLVDSGDKRIKEEMEISIQAGEIVGVLYDEILKQYVDPTSETSLKSLNKLCVRLVFCLYAEDAGIFGKRGMFHDYLAAFSAGQLRGAIIDLFKVLDEPLGKRDPYMDDALSAFPYVNGGLFSDEHIEIPRLNERIRDLLLTKASDDFDWSRISPTIFGAVFESTLNPETRRAGGMHYTSIENIHKVIDPLFLDDLKKELDEISAIKTHKVREARLREYQIKLSRTLCFDPACGSGNFLTETYISLRRLENATLRCLFDGQVAMGLEEVNPIQVSIGQFYGIEINDFAVTVAKTALWIAESQMLKETEDVVHMNLDFLPLKTYANIVEGNALRIDWESVVPKDKLGYIMGNPPFVGYTYQTPDQKQDILSTFVNEDGKPYKAIGKIDYVAMWYYKAAQMMKGSDIRAAFVSTNSITQGEQVSVIWKPLLQLFDVQIDFAWQTFKWNSESKGMAAVHCVIIGFSSGRNILPKRLFISDSVMHEAAHINPYLVEAPDVFIDSRTKPLCDVPEMTTGNRPADGGHLIIEADEYDDFIRKDPLSVKYIKRFIGSYEFINNKPRWCLWLVNADPGELSKCPEVMRRVNLCRIDRENAVDAGRRKLALTPTLFREAYNPETFVVIPEVSSERRRYVPMGYMSHDVICSNLVKIIPNAELYHFGVLTSNVHMAWMRTVCGRLKSDYRYSKDVVYNNFPWPNPTVEQRKAIEATAQAILDARAMYPDCSLATMYGESSLLPPLIKAHQQNDRAVMQAYGFSIKDTTESSCVAALMEMYAKLTKHNW